jgi:hypothetical protein
MGNNSSLARTALLWGLTALVAFFVLKMLVGIVFGAISMLFTLLLLAVLAYAVIWAVRRL